jgi:presenilin-like A22 family membrane protease
MKILYIKHTVPILISILLSWSFTLIIQLSEFQPQTLIITPYPEPESTTPPTEALTTLEPYCNALIFTGVIVLGGLLVYFIIKIRRRLLRSLLITSYLISGFGVFYIYNVMMLSIIPIGVDINILEILLIIIPVIEDVVMVYLVFCTRGFLQAASMIVFGTAAGSWVGSTLKLWSTLLLLVMLSIYDIVAVYKGPVKAIVEDNPKDLTGLVVMLKEINIGLGDIVFYSLTQSFSIINYGYIPALGVSLGLIVGFYITIKIAEKTKKPVPALPASLILAFIIIQVLGLIQY